jgi:hypothetical protein
MIDEFGSTGRLGELSSAGIRSRETQRGSGNRTRRHQAETADLGRAVNPDGDCQVTQPAIDIEAAAVLLIKAAHVLETRGEQAYAMTVPCEENDLAAAVSVSRQRQSDSQRRDFGKGIRMMNQ